MTGYDLSLGNYFRSIVTMYCPDYDCPGSDGVSVVYEKEYGFGVINPDECPLCRKGLVNDKPEPPDPSTLDGALYYMGKER